VAQKDRGSILPAGHAADAAYWYDPQSGNWITSSWYMNTLPVWLTNFNLQRNAEKYLKNDWNTLYPIDTYVQSTSDDNNYEEPFMEGEKVTFPIKCKELSKKIGLGFITETPFGATFTLDVAKLAIENEELGKDNITDFLTISLSSPDYIGHQFGANSVKIEDCYLRLDKDLADFFNFLDNKAGKGNYLLFLTADHAGAHNGQFLLDHKISAGNWNSSVYQDSLNNYLQKKFGAEKLVLSLNNYQVNYNYKNTKNLDIEKIKKETIDYLQHFDNVQYVVDMKKVSEATIPSVVKEKIINGYNRELSGELQIILKSGWYSDNNLRGATHGTWNPYDAHIPLLFMGWGIQQGESNREVYMTDIAPTIAALLKIQMPSGCIGKPIVDLFKK
jgi:predicted AlkP superfamily pyrophosphatase or phosphodiesterase